MQFTRTTLHKHYQVTHNFSSLGRVLNIFPSIEQRAVIMICQSVVCTLSQAHGGVTKIIL